MSASDAKGTVGKRRARQTGVRAAGQAGIEARKRAAAVLEVLAGMRTPGEAAAALGVSPPRYYLLEQRAIAALVGACEPCARGPQRSAQRQVARLERELARLKGECGRHQALARAAQRSIGLNPPAVPRPAQKPGVTGGKRRRARRPVVRALRMAKSLQGADSSGTEATSGVQQSPVSS